MLSKCLFLFSKLLFGINSNSHVLEDNDKQKIYFANHTSHLDTISILSALPNDKQKKTRPVAAADYWGKSILTRYISKKVLNCVLIDRKKGCGGDPLIVVYNALMNNDSIIIFPEGTRGMGDEPVDFKAGLYHLHKKFPRAELIPVYLNNVNRSMPKGQTVPVPLICTIVFGKKMELVENESKEDFLSRARQEVISLKLKRG